MVLQYPMSPQDTTNSPMEEFSTWILCRTLLLVWRHGTWYPPVPSSPPIHPTVASLAQPLSHSQGTMVMVLRFSCWFVHTYCLPWLPPLGCVSQGAGWRWSLSAPNFHLKECFDTSGPHAPNPHSRNILSHCNKCLSQ